MTSTATCLDHRKTVVVLDGSVVYHRKDGSECDGDVVSSDGREVELNSPYGIPAGAIERLEAYLAVTSAAAEPDHNTDVKDVEDTDLITVHLAAEGFTVDVIDPPEGGATAPAGAEETTDSDVAARPGGAGPAHRPPNYRGPRRPRGVPATGHAQQLRPDTLHH